MGFLLNGSYLKTDSMTVRLVRDADTSGGMPEPEGDGRLYSRVGNNGSFTWAPTPMGDVRMTSLLIQQDTNFINNDDIKIGDWIDIEQIFSKIDEGEEFSRGRLCHDRYGNLGVCLEIDGNGKATIQILSLNIPVDNNGDASLIIERLRDKTKVYHDSNAKHVTDAEKQKWDNKQDKLSSSNAGDNVIITPDGKINATDTKPVQSDWEAANANSSDFIKNKPNVEITAVIRDGLPANITQDALTNAFKANNNGKPPREKDRLVIIKEGN
jgi:hypothetical protein